MDHAVIRFPVKCPCCGQESLAATSFDTIVSTLTTERRLRLSSECEHHRAVWVANDIERDQIREYAAAVQFSKQAAHFYHWRARFGGSPPS
jgi:hypothetical protein